MRAFVTASCLAPALLFGSFASAPAQHDHHHHPVLGKVHFPVSCSAEAQAHFDEGMKLQHSFWYRESEKKFQTCSGPTQAASWRIGGGP